MKKKKLKDEMKAVLQVFARKPIPRGQLRLFKALYEAGPDGVSKTDLAERMRRGDEERLTGVLGALGKRVNGSWDFEITKPGIDFLIERLGGKKAGGIFYRILPELQKAIDTLTELKAVLDLPYNEIQKRYDGKSKALALSVPPSLDPGLEWVCKRRNIVVKFIRWPPR